jgi:carbonic anhydrase/acetyltransferase-like protein (isoleucine patch superfamily)
MIEDIADKRPRLHETVYVHPMACVMGDVVAGEACSIWPMAVLRGDEAPICLGARANVQDGAVLHGGVQVGADVTIGHRAVVHGALVEDRVLIGMGAIVLDGARIGADSIIAAGAVVPPGRSIPPGSMVMGVPAAVKRPLSQEEVQSIVQNAQVYGKLGQESRARS